MRHDLANFLAHPGLAIAGARAGGVGLLDLQWVDDDEVDRSSTNLEGLLAATSPSQWVGLRLDLEDVRSRPDLLGRLRGRPHWLVVHGWSPGEIREDLAGLTECESRSVWLEVSDHRQLEHSADLPDFAGWIARGSECGGWVGQESAFLLAQWLARQARPFLVQGGIGLHAAAACRAAGAAGVVIEEQLWLMPESPLAEDRRELLGHLGGQDCPRIGGPLGAACRIAARPNLPGGFELVEVVERVGAESGDPVGRREEWRRAARERLGWGAPDRRAWPVGQCIGLAGPLARRFKTTGRLVRAIIEGVEAQLEVAQQLGPLAPEAPLARSHGTRYPIVQGPMTRVSDRAEFAAAVSSAGGLPLLALAVLDRENTRDLLDSTRRLLGDQPWGVGLLGFIDPELRRHQIEAVRDAQTSLRPDRGRAAGPGRRPGGRGDRNLLARAATGLAPHVPRAGVAAIRLRGLRVRRACGPADQLRALGVDGRGAPGGDPLRFARDESGPRAVRRGRPRRLLGGDGRGPGRTAGRARCEGRHADGDGLPVHSGGGRLRRDRGRLPAAGLGLSADRGAQHRPGPRDSMRARLRSPTSSAWSGSG